MAAQVLWILLTLFEVVHSEQPVFVPSATELSDAPPENKIKYSSRVLLIKLQPFWILHLL